jgi:hypothetical protein
MARFLATLLVFALCAGAAGAAKLPGVKTPSRNISCFYVPVKPTTHGNLLCNIKRASYTGALQHQCIDGAAGLDWHGFSLSETKKAQVVCSGGVLYDIGRDTPRYVVLAYGRSWHYEQFACVSRVTGLTCTNRAGHGLFLSRASYRLF